MPNVAGPNLECEPSRRTHLSCHERRRRTKKLFHVGLFTCTCLQCRQNTKFIHPILPSQLVKPRASVSAHRTLVRSQSIERDRNRADANPTLKPLELRSGKRLQCSSEQQLNEGGVDHGFGGLLAEFAFFEEASGAVEPSEGSFYDPAYGQDLEALPVAAFEDLRGVAEICLAQSINLPV